MDANPLDDDSPLAILLDSPLNTPRNGRLLVSQILDSQALLTEYQPLLESMGLSYSSGCLYVTPQFFKTRHNFIRLADSEGATKCVHRIAGRLRRVISVPFAV